MDKRGEVAVEMMNGLFTKAIRPLVLSLSKDETRRTATSCLDRLGMSGLLMAALIAVMLCMTQTPADASTMRLTSTTDTSFNPGVFDDTKTAGETFALELWVNASDTDVNGMEATIQFDGTKISLVESSELTDSFPQASVGVNSDEDHTYYGDIHFNYGISAGTANDTARYAALTNSDSIKLDARCVRFTFQIGIGVSTCTTVISFVSSATETTAVTHADGTGRNVLTGLDTGYINILASASVPRVWYVNDTSTVGDSYTYTAGSDTHNGMADTSPFFRIDSAVAALRSGDTIKVDAGTFISNATLNIDTYPIWILGVDSVATMIDFSDSSAGSNRSLYMDTVYNVTLRNFGIRNSYRGILARNVDTSTFDRISVSTCGIGMLFEPTSDSNSIVNCRITGAVAEGISLLGADRNLIESNSCFSNGAAGISLGTGSDTNTIRYNRLTSNAGSGLTVFDTSIANIVNANTAETNAASGVNVASGASMSTIQSNLCYGNTQNGISLNGVQGSMVSSNTADSNGTYGISLSSASASSLSSNTVTRSGLSGIYVVASSNCVIDTNTVSVNTAKGIHLDHSDTSAAVRANTCFANLGDGIYLANASDSSVIRENTSIGNGGVGISVAQANGVFILDNTSDTNASHGVSIASGANSATIQNNIARKNGAAGLYMDNVAGAANYVVQNEFDSNATWGVQLTATATNITFDKNNLMPEPNETNALFCDNAAITAFTRNYWNTADSSAVRNNINGAAAPTAVYTPFRLGSVDTSVNADTVSPMKVDTVAAALSAPTSITVTWSPVTTSDQAESSLSLAGYKVYRALGDTASTWTLRTSVGSGTLSYTDGGLGSNTRYYYKVTAFDSASPYTNEAFFSDSAPSDMTGFSASSQIKIAAIQVDDAGAADGDAEWVLFHNPTDTPVSMNGWIIRDSGGATTEVTMPDSTIAAHGWLLVGDLNFNTLRDFAAWPNADVLDAMTFTNGGDGITLLDSTWATIDRVGWEGEAVDVESSPIVTSANAILVRKAHALSTLNDMLIGGRDEIGALSYDMGDNLTDFIVIPMADTPNWTLRSSATSTETVARKTTVVKMLSSISDTTRYKNETGVIAAMLFIQGDTTTTGTLNTFRVSTTDPIEDTNFSAIRLYHDANANRSLDAGDTLVATLPALGGSIWETTGMAYTFNSYAGETFLVTLDISSTVTNGETFQAVVGLRTVKASGADSGPSIARTSSGKVALSSMTPISVTRNGILTNDTVSTTADTKTVMAIRISGSPSGDTLTMFGVMNSASLDSNAVAQVRLWKDLDASYTYSTGDLLVSTLIATASKTWSDTAISHYIDSGANFVVTIDLGTAAAGDSFTAYIAANTVRGTIYETGPTSTVTETGRVTVSTAMNVTMMLTEVNSQGAPDYVELYVLDDGNGGAGVNVAGWYISDFGSATDRKIFGDTDSNGTLDTTVIVYTGTRMVIYDGAGLDSNVVVSSIMEFYDTGIIITGTDDEVILYDSDNNARDAVCWADRSGAHGDAADLTAVIALGQWKTTSANENGCVTPRSGTAFAQAIQRGGFVDRDTYLDWGEGTATAGAANSIESPAVAPNRLTVLNLLDVPNDMGGSIRLTWTPDTSNSDFKEYRVYLETVPIENMLDSNIRPYATSTDSTLSYYVRSGLTNGESWYATVTAVDSWGLEYRFGLNDTGPAAAFKDVTGTPAMRITEVKFSGSGDTSEFIEIFVVNDGNPSGQLNISGFKVAKDDTVTGDIISFGSITATDSDYIVLREASGTSETDSGGDGVINIYGLATLDLDETDEGIFVIQAGGDTILDFVSWSNRDGAISAAEQTDLTYAILRGAWSASGVFQNDGRNPMKGTDFDDTYSITRNNLLQDNNGDTDWAIDTIVTPGAVTSITEAPFAAPAAIAGTNADDVPGDLGGSVRVRWTASVAADLHHYNIYRDTSAIPASLYGTNLRPRDTAPASETTVLVTNLNNTETYWFAVTAVDSYGNELKTGLVSDTAVPTVNVSGETLLFTEVSFKEDNVGTLGNDWVEIKVVYDGNSNSGITLNGWKVVASSTFDPSKSLDGVFVYTGEYIMIHSTTGTDETDTASGNADGKVDLYWTSGLTATDNSLTLYRPTSDTEDFVAWTQPSVAPVNSADSEAINKAIATGHWTDIGAPGVDVDDGVNSDSASTNWSISRSPDTGDLNTKADWAIDSTPTPGTTNDSGTLWRITGTVDLESRANDGGCTILAYSATDTFITFTDAAGSFVIRVTSGAYTVRTETTHYLIKRVTNFTIADSSMINQYLGVMYAGDANGDNMINILDGSITKYAIDRATGNPLADHVDPIGTINAEDLRAVRENFGRIGD